MGGGTSRDGLIPTKRKKFSRTVHGLRLCRGSTCSHDVSQLIYVNLLEESKTTVSYHYAHKYHVQLCMCVYIYIYIVKIVLSGRKTGWKFSSVFDPNKKSRQSCYIYQSLNSHKVNLRSKGYNMNHLKSVFDCLI